MELRSTHQADVTEVEQAERSGGDGFSLDEVLQDVGGRGLDVTVVLTQTQTEGSVLNCPDPETPRSFVSPPASEASLRRDERRSLTTTSSSSS